jgi:hypothetical protein
MCTCVILADFEIVRKMKETTCYIATDFKQEALKPDKSTDINKTYELPDGKVVSMGSERFKCAEAIFQPSLMGKLLSVVATAQNRKVQLGILVCDIVVILVKVTRDQTHTSAKHVPRIVELSGYNSESLAVDHSM